jgi:hypothetical protein
MIINHGLDAVFNLTVNTSKSFAYGREFFNGE